MSERGGYGGGGGDEKDDDHNSNNNNDDVRALVPIRISTQEEFEATVAFLRGLLRIEREQLVKRNEQRRLEREQREQLEQRNEQLRLEREQLEQRNEQLRLEREQLEQRNEQREREREIEREIERAFEEGTFYSNIDQVWGTCGSQGRSLLLRMHELCRDNCPGFLARRANPDAPGTAEYVVTRERALQAGEPAADAQSESRTTTRNETIIWPTDIFGNEESGDVAHLIPASPRDATLYVDVARCALGVPESVQDWDTLQKMIHGSREENGRHPHTGIKHFVANKIRLERQDKYLDGAPCVLIVPVMTSDEMKNWNGEGYNAVVMVGHSEQYNHTVKGICKGIRMGKPPNSNRVEPEDPPVPFDVRYCIADRGQVERARQLLEQILLGLADSLVNHLKKPDILDRLTEDQRAVLNTLGDDLLFAGQLFLPEANGGTYRVRLVSFEAHLPPDIPPNPQPDTSPYSKHPAPDPLLLAIRAGITWSWRHRQKMLATTEPQDEDDELSELAYEQYLADYADAIRPKTEKDLARGLRQEGGYKEENILHGGGAAQAWDLRVGSPES